MHRFLFLLLSCFLGVTATAQTSQRVFRDSDDRLRYITDSGDNHIMDYSHAGYQNGEEPIPDITHNRRFVSPGPGDDTRRIQRKIWEVGGLPPDEDGFRGVVQLRAGVYQINGVLRMPTSGVILRGSGRGNGTSDTVLKGKGRSPARRALIIVGGQSGINWSGSEGPRRTITSPFLPAGSRTVQVNSTSGFNVGNNVIIRQPSTTAWLRSVDFGATATDGPWEPGDLDIFYNRRITAINRGDRKITLDAPIADHLNRNLATSQIYRFNDNNIRTNIGIENLRIDVDDTEGGSNPRHIRTCILMQGVDNCWVKRVTGQDFSYALTDHQQATRVTVENCEAFRPKSPIAGGFRYNFAVNSQTNNILFKDCKASQGRHTFVSNGASQSSSIVFTNCESKEDYSTSEGHRRWIQGLLFDDISFTDSRRDFRPAIGLWNRGDSGTGHGWSSVNSVAWNVRAPSNTKIIVQRPPGRQNYAIGCRGRVSGNGFYDHPTGFIELTGRTPAIPSLYQAQLAERLNKGVAPDAPARLRLTRNNSRTNTLTWLDIAARETAYIVEISRNGGDSFRRLTRVARNSTRYVHRGVNDNGTQIVYRVYAEGPLPSPYSNNARGRSSNSLQAPGISIINTAASEILTAFPNPTDGELTVAGLPTGEFDLQITDLRGRSLISRHYSAATAKVDIRVQELPRGTYLLIVRGQYSTRTQRFVKH